MGDRNVAPRMHVERLGDILRERGILYDAGGTLSNNETRAGGEVEGNDQGVGDTASWVMNKKRLEGPVPTMTPWACSFWRCSSPDRRCGS